MGFFPRESRNFVKFRVRCSRRYEFSRAHRECLRARVFVACVTCVCVVPKRDGTADESIRQPWSFDAAQLLIFLLRIGFECTHARPGLSVFFPCLMKILINSRTVYTVRCAGFSRFFGEPERERERESAKILAVFITETGYYYLLFIIYIYYLLFIIYIYYLLFIIYIYYLLFIIIIIYYLYTIYIQYNLFTPLLIINLYTPLTR